MTNYKEAALSHVRSICSELKCRVCNGYGYTSEHSAFGHNEWGECSECPVQEQCDVCQATGIGHTPELRHWLMGIGTQSDELAVRGCTLLIPKKGTITDVHYNLTKDGNNQSEDFYRSYCDIIGLSVNEV